VQGLPHSEESGGMSGAPVREKSTAMIASLSRMLDGALPIIGVGGIMSAAHAREKLQAGASLVQLYSGMVFHGPQLIGDILRGLARQR
jgi:dihydroorotate dehydrogenase